MISGVILSAGASNRMGSPKALLKIDGKTFLQHIVDVLHSARITDIVIVLGESAENIERTLTWFNGKIVINEAWQKGQLTSIISGINILDEKKPDGEEMHGAMICPVDHPIISQSLLVDLLQGYWLSKKDIIIPTFRGQRGHPVIFGKTMFTEIRNASEKIGAREVVHNHSDRVHEVPVDTEGVVINIDTQDDYRKYIIGHGS